MEQIHLLVQKGQKSRWPWLKKSAGARNWKLSNYRLPDQTHKSQRSRNVFLSHSFTHHFAQNVTNYILNKILPNDFPRNLGELKFKQKGREEQCEPDNPAQAKKVESLPLWPSLCHFGPVSAPVTIPKP